MEQPRRKMRKRTPMEAFKQDRLPLIIAAVAVILILVFIIGSICLAVERGKANKRLARKEAAEKAQHELWDKEQHQVAAEADALMAQLDYEKALAVLEAFGGDPKVYTAVGTRLTDCRNAMDTMVVWNDPGKVVNLSFQMLIADTGRAFNYPVYGGSINKNFLTVEEFGKLLQQMYESGYVLVDRHDIVETKTAEDGTLTYIPKELKLPEGKKPLMLTETNANYNAYLVDPNGDGQPDAEGAGFAAKLMVDEDGVFVNELMTKDGKLVRGDYDVVPILEKFIATHPGFSYKGARATIALTGKDGLFGYRTNTGADKEAAKKVADALKETGYTLACYSYGNEDYSYLELGGVQNDLKKWAEEVEPIIGKVDTFVFAQGADIGGAGAYKGEKFNTLYEAGFRYFIGFCDNGKAWAGGYKDYFRQGRILVTAGNLKSHAQWFAGMFDPELVLDAARPAIN